MTKRMTIHIRDGGAVIDTTPDVTFWLELWGNPLTLRANDENKDWNVLEIRDDGELHRCAGLRGPCFTIEGDLNKIRLSSDD